MPETSGITPRLISDNTVKICGGSFGGSLDYETVNRLVKSHFTVTVKPSGRAVFVDREGREVSLYLLVDAGMTTKLSQVNSQLSAAQAKLRSLG